MNISSQAFSLKKGILGLFFILNGVSVYCQNLEAANWILGYLPESFQGVQIDFSSGEPELFSIPINMELLGSNASISNKMGDLLFYSNGCFISNSVHDTMPNSLELTPGFTEQGFCRLGSGGPFNESQIIIPSNEEDHIYYLLQTINHDGFILPQDSLAVAPFDLVYSIIDMDEEGGLGAVREKHISILEDTISNNGFQAIKHANGLDWWIIAPEFNSNCYYPILYANGVFELKQKQCIGFKRPHLDTGNQSVVSPNGEVYIRYSTRYGLTILKFDRCTGFFNSPAHLDGIIDTTTLGGVAISPNSKLLYASTLKKLYQYNLEADDIKGSNILIDEYDGNTNPGQTNIFRAALALDGKIYWNSLTNTYNLHVINKPDSLGLNCEFIQNAVELPNMNARSIPTFPNYDLKALETPCEALVSPNCEGGQASDILVFPNPTERKLTVSGIFKVGSQFCLMDALGRRMYSRKLSILNETFELPSSISNGIYFYSILEEGNCINSGKLVVL